MNADQRNVDSRQRRRVGIWSPSRAVRDDQAGNVVAAAELLTTTYGWDVQFAPGWRACSPWGSAGTVTQRVAGLETLLDGDIDAVLCTQGGDSAVELLDRLPYERLAETSTLLVGMSDNSLLANAVLARGGRGAVGPDCKYGPDDRYADGWLNHPWTREQLARLFTTGPHTIEPPAGFEVHELVAGTMCGPLIGGNLHCWVKAAGSSWMPPIAGAVMCIETFGGSVDQICADLYQLRLHHPEIIDVAGVLLGGMDSVDRGPNPDGDTAHIVDRINEVTDGRPVVRHRSFGHRCPHTLLPLGHNAHWDGNTLTVTY